MKKNESMKVKKLPLPSKFEDINYSVSERCALITMNRPKVLNALSQRMFRDLAQALRSATRDRNVSFIIITGAGKAFSAGLDIIQVARMNKRLDAHRFVYHLVKPFWETFLSSSKPIIALVNGPAYGAGAEIALFSDFVLASETAVFAFSGGRVGALCCISPILGPLLFNGRKVAEMNLTGHPMSALEAEKLGMVNYVASEAEIRVKLEELKGHLMKVSPDSNASFKRIGRKVVPRQAYAIAYAELLRTLTSSNFHKGVEAFVAKRPPEYYPPPS